MASRTAKAVAPKSSLYRLVDQKMGGELADVLAARRAERDSWEDIAKKLHTEHEILVSGETLRLWAKQLGIVEPTAAGKKAS